MYRYMKVLTDLFCQKLSAFKWIRVWTLCSIGIENKFVFASLEGSTYESALLGGRRVHQPLLSLY